MDFFGIVAPEVDAWDSFLRDLPYDFFHTPTFARAWQSELGLTLPRNGGQIGRAHV
jgi:hypothetical protein